MRFACAASPRSKQRGTSAHNARRTLSAVFFSAQASTFSASDMSGMVCMPFCSSDSMSVVFACASSFPVSARPLRGPLFKISSKRPSASANCPRARYCSATARFFSVLAVSFILFPPMVRLATRSLSPFAAGVTLPASTVSRRYTFSAVRFSRPFTLTCLIF